MRPVSYSADSIARLLRQQKIATLPELMTALGTVGERTVFRKLSQLAYRTSYSHRGAFYTLDESAEFDTLGLWSFRSVWFSARGTLLESAAALIEEADTGYFVDELDNVLHVATKDALRKLARDGRIGREQIGGQYLYCSAATDQRRRQLRTRRALQAEPRVGGPLPRTDALPDELKATLVLFFSLLDEKQRRLYAGLESLKMGRGGDGRIAELLSLDEGTVARGRGELSRHDVQVERVRRVGGGRIPVEKKHRKSSPALKS